MASERPDDGSFDGEVAPPRLVPAVSSRSFTDDRLFQLARLRGDDPHGFDPVFLREDTLNKQFVQSYAVAAMPSAEFEITGRGPETLNKVVGWMRARFERAFRGHRPFADIGEAYVDPAVDRMAVQSFLLRRLQDRVRRSRDKLAGLRVVVPPELTHYTRHYMEHGFREARNDDELAWRSDD